MSILDNWLKRIVWGGEDDEEQQRPHDDLGRLDAMFADYQRSPSVEDSDGVLDVTGGVNVGRDADVESPPPELDPSATTWVDSGNFRTWRYEAPLGPALRGANPVDVPPYLPPGTRNRAVAGDVVQEYRVPPEIGPEPDSPDFRNRAVRGGPVDETQGQQSPQGIQTTLHPDKGILPPDPVDDALSLLGATGEARVGAEQEPGQATRQTAGDPVEDAMTLLGASGRAEVGAEQVPPGGRVAERGARDILLGTSEPEQPGLTEEERLRREAERAYIKRQFQDMSHLPPAMRRWMDPEYDSMEAVPGRRPSTLEQQRGEPISVIDRDMGTLEALTSAGQRSSINARVTMLDAGAELMRMAGLDEIGDWFEADADRVKSYLYDHPEVMRRSTEHVLDGPFGIVEAVAESGASIAPTLLGAMLVVGGARLRSPGLMAAGTNLSRVALLTGSAQAFGGQARELRDEVQQGELSPDAARTLAMGAGIVEYLTEKMFPGADRDLINGMGDETIKRFAAEMRKRGLLGVGKEVGKETGQEAAEEMVSEAYGVAVDAVFTDEKPTLLEAAKRIGTAGLVGGVSGALIAAPSQGAAIMMDPEARGRVGDDIKAAGRGLAEEGARQLLDMTPMPRIVPARVGEGLPVETQLPTQPMVLAAIENTPTATLTPAGVEINVARWQRARDAGLPTLRGGIFYVRAGHDSESDYSRGRFYGGPVRVPEGEEDEDERTLYKAPLFVASAGPGEGNLQINAFDRLNGKGSYGKLGAQIRRVWRDVAGDVNATFPLGDNVWNPATRQHEAREGLGEQRLDALYAVVAPYGVEREDVRAIARQFSYREDAEIALKESALSMSARRAGHDGVLGIETHWKPDPKNPGRLVKHYEIGEIFDLREAAIPTPEGGYTLHPEFLRDGREEGQRLSRALPPVGQGSLFGDEEPSAPPESQGVGERSRVPGGVDLLGEFQVEDEADATAFSSSARRVLDRARTEGVSADRLTSAELALEMFDESPLAQKRGRRRGDVLDALRVLARDLEAPPSPSAAPALAPSAQSAPETDRIAEARRLNDERRAASDRVRDGDDSPEARQASRAAREALKAHLKTLSNDELVEAMEPHIARQVRKDPDDVYLGGAGSVVTRQRNGEKLTDVDYAVEEWWSRRTPEQKAAVTPSEGDRVGGLIQSPTAAVVQPTQAQGPTQEQPAEPSSDLQPSEPDEDEGGGYEYSSTQLDLPPDLAQKVIALGQRIPDADLAEDGRETTPHVTVKYGLETTDPEAVREIVESHGPITVTLGKTSIFPANRQAGGKPGAFDVVKVDVESPELRELNAQLSKLPNGDVHPTYVPHVTLAYVMPGRGREYAGSRVLEGERVTITELTFSSKDGGLTTIPLRGAVSEVAPAVAQETEQNTLAPGSKAVYRTNKGKAVDVDVIGEGTGSRDRGMYRVRYANGREGLVAGASLTPKVPRQTQPSRAPAAQTPAPSANATDETRTVDLQRAGEIPGVGPGVFGQPRHDAALLDEIAGSESVRNAHAALAPVVEALAEDAKQRGLVPSDVTVTFGGFALGDDFGAFSMHSNDGKRLVVYVNLHHSVWRHRRQGSGGSTMAAVPALSQEIIESIAHEIAHAEIAGHPTKLDEATGAQISEVDALAEQILEQAERAGGVDRGAVERMLRQELPLLRVQSARARKEGGDAGSGADSVGDARGQRGDALRVRERDQEAGRGGEHAAEGVRGAEDAVPPRADAGRAGRETGEGRARVGERGDGAKRLRRTEPRRGSEAAAEEAQPEAVERPARDARAGRVGADEGERDSERGAPAPGAGDDTRGGAGDRVQDAEPGLARKRPATGEGSLQRDVLNAYVEAGEKGIDSRAALAELFPDDDFSDVIYVRDALQRRGDILSIGDGYTQRIAPEVLRRMAQDSGRASGPASPAAPSAAQIADARQRWKGKSDGYLRHRHDELQTEANDRNTPAERVAEARQEMETIRLALQGRRSTLVGERDNLRRTESREPLADDSFEADVLEAVHDSNAVSHWQTLEQVAERVKSGSALSGEDVSRTSGALIRLMGLGLVQTQRLTNSVIRYLRTAAGDADSRRRAMERGRALRESSAPAAGRGTVETEGQTDAAAATTAERSATEPRGAAARGEGEARAPGRSAESVSRAGQGEQPGRVRPDEGAAGAGGRQGPERAGGRDVPGGAGGRVQGERPALAGAQAPAPSAISAGQDAVFDPADDALEEKSAPRRFDNNLAALELLAHLEAERRPPTAAEQRTLARYSGFGDSGFNEAFPAYGEPRGGIWADRRARLKAALRALARDDKQADEFFRSIERSRTNAMYTTPEVIAAIWHGMTRLGAATIDRPRVLEPSAGSGRFLGLMPREVGAHAQKAAVELDEVTGRLLQKLFPASFVQVTGFQDAVLPNDGFDIVISNVPFSEVGVVDRDWPRSMQHLQKPLHNYFFAKALEKVRPGGVIAFVTSRYTMDAKSAQGKAFRQYMADRADLLSAVRLPSGAFPDTEVTVDVIFLQKREPGSGPGDQSWVDTTEHQEMVKTGSYYSDYRTGRQIEHTYTASYDVNNYYGEHPDHVLGTHSTSGTMYRGGEYAVALTDESWLDRFMGIMGALPEGRLRPASTTQPLAAPSLEARAEAAKRKPNAYYVDADGRLMKAELHGRTIAPKPAGLKGAQEQRVRGMLDIRDLAQRLLDVQAAGENDVELAAAQHALSTAHDAYVRLYGPLSASANADLMKQDPDGGLLRSLEALTPAEAKSFPSAPTRQDLDAIKAPIFTQRVTAAGARVERADTSNDAMLISLNEHGLLHWPRMSELTGQTEERLQADLLDQGLVFEDPEGSFVPSDEYLSGNVRRKLQKAEAAAQADARFQRNVDALRAVVPEDLLPGQVGVSIGAPWMPAGVVNAFAREVLGVSPESYRHGSEFFNYVPEAGTWVQVVKKTSSSRQAQEDWGTDYFTPMGLLELALAGKVPIAYDTDGNGNRVRNESQTRLAQDKLDQIKQRFGEWVWEDERRGEQLAETYNDQFNGTRPREYDGSHLTLPGSNPEIELRPHQKNVVWRIVQEGTTLMAHEVGFGKTMAMVAAGMELRRLGLSKRNLYVVKNGTLEQFAAEFRLLYPGAKILVEDDTLTKSRRNEFMARIATGDWDAVIIQQSKFTLLPVREETQIAYAEERIAEIEAALLARGENAKHDVVQKQLQKAKDREQNKIDRWRTAIGKRQDQGVTFEDLGIDTLFVDEADLYKSLPFVSRMDRMKGIPQSDSQRAPDMYLKARIVSKRNGGRGVVFATGTPISNSIAEAWIMMKFLIPERLDALGVGHFDAWAQTFGDVESDFEPNAAGVWQPVTRFASFKNVPELSALWQSVADIMMAADAPEMVKRRPTLVGGEHEGERILVTSPASPDLLRLMQGFQERLDTLKRMGRSMDPRVDNYLKVYNDARMAAVDVRMVDPKAPEEPNGKLQQVSERVFQVWQEEDARKGTQLVFLDAGTPKPPRAPIEAKDGEIADEWAERMAEAAAEEHAAAQVQQRIRDRLVERGIPPEQIAFASTPKNRREFEALLEKVRTGEVRVLIGTTEKMGAGVNVQHRLAAEHHVNPGWRPRDLEQREGRIIRQGNRVYGPTLDRAGNVVDTGLGVRIYQYVTAGSFDALSWRILLAKARGIRQLMRRHVTERRIEDAGDIVESFATASAAASGRPEALRLVKVNGELDKLGAIRRAWQQGQGEAQYRVKALPSAIERAEEAQRAVEADVRKRDAAPADPVIGRTSYDERDKANAAVAEALRKVVKSRRAGEIGTYRGFTITVRPRMGGEGSQGDESLGQLVITLEGAEGYEVSRVWGRDFEVMVDSADWLTRLKNAADRIAHVAQERGRQTADRREQLRVFEERLKAPFQYAERYDQLIAEQARLEAVLATAPDPNAPVQTDVPAEDIVQSMGVEPTNPPEAEASVVVPAPRPAQEVQDARPEQPPAAPVVAEEPAAVAEATAAVGEPAASPRDTVPAAVRAERPPAAPVPEPRVRPGVAEAAPEAEVESEPATAAPPPPPPPVEPPAPPVAAAPEPEEEPGGNITVPESGLGPRTTAPAARNGAMAVAQDVELLRGYGRREQGDVHVDGVPTVASESGAVFATSDSEQALRYADWGGGRGGVLPFVVRKGAWVADLSNVENGVRLIEKVAEAGYGTQRFSIDELEDAEYVRGVAQELADTAGGLSGDSIVAELQIMDEYPFVEAAQQLGWDAVTDGRTWVIVNPDALGPAYGRHLEDWRENAPDDLPGGEVEATAVAPPPAQPAAAHDDAWMAEMGWGDEDSTASAPGETGAAFPELHPTALARLARLYAAVREAMAEPPGTSDFQEATDAFKAAFLEEAGRDLDSLTEDERAAVMAQVRAASAMPTDEEPPAAAPTPVPAPTPPPAQPAAATAVAAPPTPLFDEQSVEKRLGYGNVAAATGADPTVQYEVQYRVVSLDSLIPSHTDEGAANPAFPSALQPRARDRAASRLQIERIARNLEPGALLTDVHRLDAGPPIVGPDLVVESGNGRTLALRRAAQRFPERLATYEAALRGRLAEYGLTESDLEGVEHPVLVRERQTPMTESERAAFAAEANNAGLLGMSSYELAVHDAARLSDEMVANMIIGEADTIASALRRVENRPLIRAFAGAIPSNQRAEIFDADGNLNAQGYTRLSNAILVKTFGAQEGERIARAFIESADPTVRNVETAVMASLPVMARAEALVRRGERDADLTLGPDLAAAIHTMSRLRTSGASVADYLSQQSLWEHPTTPLQDKIMAFLDANSRGPGRLRTALRGYAEGVENAPHPDQGSMFGDIAGPTREELWDAAVRRAAGEAPVEAPAVDQEAGPGLDAAGPAGPVRELGQAQPGAAGPSGAGLAEGLEAAETLTPEEQIERLQAENDRLHAENRQQPRTPRQVLRGRGEQTPEDRARQRQERVQRILRARRGGQGTPPVEDAATAPASPESALAAPGMSAPESAQPTPSAQPSTAPVSAPPAQPPTTPPAGAPPGDQGAGRRVVHTVGAGYWATDADEEQVQRFREMLDEWAQFSRSGGVAQTEIARLAELLGQDTEAMHALILRAAGQDTRTPATEQQALRDAVVVARDEAERLRQQLADLKRMRRGRDSDGSTDADIEATAQSLAAAEANLRLIGTAERRNVEGAARLLNQQRFVVAAGAGAEIVNRIDASVDEMAGLLRQLGELQQRESMTEDDHAAIDQLIDLLGENANLMTGNDPSVRRVFDSIRRALGEQGQRDKPPTAAEDKIAVGKAENLQKQIEKEAPKLDTPTSRPRASQQGRAVALSLQATLKEKILFLNRQGLTRAEIVNALTPEERRVIARSRPTPPVEGERLSRALPDVADDGWTRYSRALSPDAADEFDFLLDVVGGVLDEAGVAEPTAQQRRRRRQQNRQEQADERHVLAREIVEVDQRIRQVRRTNPAALGGLLEQRADLSNALEDLLVDQMIEEVAGDAEEGQDVDAAEREEKIRERAAKRLVSQIARQLRGPKAPDPNDIARAAERLKNEVMDSLRVDGLMSQVPESLQELAVDLVRINKQQARLRDANDADGAAALEPARQALLDRMHALLREQTLAKLQQTNPAATMLDAEKALAKGPLSSIRKLIDEQVRYPGRVWERLYDRMERDRQRALTRDEIEAVITRLKEVNAVGRRTGRSVDVRDELKQIIDVEMAALGTAGRARAEAMREGLTRANLMRGKNAKDEDAYQNIRAAQALVDPENPETVGAFLRTLRDTGNLGYWQEAMVINLLTSPRTWGPSGINAVDNILRIAWYAMVETPVVGGRSETRALWGGMLGARKEAWQRFTEIMNQGYLTDDVRQALMTADWAQQRPELMGSTRIGWLYRGGRPFSNVPLLDKLFIPGLYHISTRPLNAVDVALGHMLFMGEMRRLALGRARELLAKNPNGYYVPAPYSDAVVYSASPDGDSGTGSAHQRQRMVPLLNANDIAQWGLQHRWHEDWRDLQEKAGKLEDYMLLRQPLDRKGEEGAEATFDRKVMGGISGIRYAPADAGLGRKALALGAHITLPFLHIAYNASKVSLSLSPLGIPVNTYRAVRATSASAKALVAGDTRAARQEAREARKFVFKAAVGTMLMFAAALLKSVDWLTGDGPDDREEYLKWRRTHEPHSIWVGGAWRRLDGLVLAMPLLVTANALEDAQEAMARAGRQPDSWDLTVGTAFLAGIGKGAAASVLGQSSLQGISDWADVWRSRKSLASFGAQLGARVVPASSLLRWTANMGDPWMRDPQEAADFFAMMSPFPGGRQSVQTKLNEWGEPIPNPQHGVLASLDPLRSTRSWGLDDPIIVKLNSIGYGLPTAPPSINNVPLTEAEKRKFTLITAGQDERMPQLSLKQTLSEIVNDPAFATLPVEAQRKILDTAVGQVRKAAANLVINDIPWEERERRRILKTQQPVPSPERRAS